MRGFGRKSSASFSIRFQVEPSFWLRRRSVRRQRRATWSRKAASAGKFVQRVVRAAPWSEPIREPEEVLLVDRVQHRDGRPLDDFVLKGGDRERALPAIRLRYC